MIRKREGWVVQEGERDQEGGGVGCSGGRKIIEIGEHDREGFEA